MTRFNLPQVLQSKALPVLICAAFLPNLATADDAAEIADLKKSAVEMQKMMLRMQTRINELETKQNHQSKEIASQAVKQKPRVSGPAAAATAVAIQPTNLAEAMAPERFGKKSPVTYRQTLNDRQTPASRPLDYTVDPEHRGYFAIPRTPSIIKLNAKARVDMTYDNRNAGSKSRFIPAKFPLKGSPSAGGGGQFNMNSNGTQLSADVLAPDQPGNFRFYYQNDFFGDEESMKYRLQHIYGQYFGLKIGYSQSVWENPDVWPDTVDYEGPNAVIFARRAVAQYTHVLNDSWNASVGIEKPDIYVDAPLKQTRAPDFAINTRWSDEKWGHVQLSSIFRDIGARDTLGQDHHDLGWGVNLGFNINPTERDSVQFLGVLGEGVAGMGNDTGFLSSDGGFNSDGSFEALPYYSLMGSWTHRWNEKYRSSLVFGHVNLDPASGMDPEFYDNSNYAAANVIWQIRERWSLGAECLYGYKEAQNGNNSGDIFRFQMGMTYSLF